MKPFSPRTLTWSYIVALLVIAGLSIGSHLLLENGLHGNRGSAAVINMAGRQRMLSQRIAGLAAQYRLGDASARPELRTAIASFESCHAKLVTESQTAALSPGAARELKDIYFSGPAPLDRAVHDFAADARRVADLPAGDPAAAAPLARLAAQARAPLLHALDSVVTIHQRESERQLGALVRLQWGILVAVIAALMIEAAFIFRPLIHRVVVYTTELLNLATIDALTGVLNRRSFMERCAQETTRMRQTGQLASVIMLDVDRFKAINDTWGHGAGDAVLRAIGGVLQTSLRDTDIRGRLGGEEFAILLAETPPGPARALAERLREQLANTAVIFEDERILFTVSIGLAALAPNADGVDEALRLADTRLYAAKQAGRNRVVYV